MKERGDWPDSRAGLAVSLSYRMPRLPAELDKLADPRIVGAIARLERRYACAVSGSAVRSGRRSVCAVGPGPCALALRDAVLRERAGELAHVERAILRERNRRGADKQSRNQKSKLQGIISIRRDMTGGKRATHRRRRRLPAQARTRPNHPNERRRVRSCACGIPATPFPIALVPEAGAGPAARSA